MRALLVLLTLCCTACAPQVSHTRLFEGVDTARTDFKVHIRYSESINQDCRELYQQGTGSRAPLMTYYAACSRIEPDVNLKPGALPTCVILLPNTDWREKLQHEILHCMGYAHE